MAVQIGLIAEDQSDADVMEEILSKFTDRGAFSLHRRLGLGCGSFILKCRAWARELSTRGCTVLIVLRDCDRALPTKIRTDISKSLSPSPIDQSVIVIPVEEIEAWLLSDVDAIRKGLSLKGKLKRIQSPERVADPKRHLSGIVDRASKHTKAYYPTQHNKVFAKHLKLSEVRRLPSFSPLNDLASKLFPRQRTRMVP